jgi:fructose-specific phosphotransferase system IIA component
MTVSDVLRNDRSELHLKSDNKEDALKELTELLYESGALTDKDAFLNDVLSRESVSTTGIGNGIAIPHGKSANVLETTAAIGRCDKPLEWESMDDKPVSFIVLLAVNENDRTGVHVKLLSQMARKLASEETCKRLVDAKTAEEIRTIFSE